MDKREKNKHIVGPYGATYCTDGDLAGLGEVRKTALDPVLQGNLSMLETEKARSLELTRSLDAAKAELFAMNGAIQVLEDANSKLVDEVERLKGELATVSDQKDAVIRAKVLRAMSREP